ncbi:hypothetical protein BH23PLA1_BH23PLA1_09460 [soil metagenome]
MDDFPAGPASPGPRRMPLSVVIPVRNGGIGFQRCLRALRDSSWTGYELIVVDDGSTDDSAAQAEAFGATVLRFQPRRGPAAARNAGVHRASSPIVFFLDADVAVHPEAIARVLERFEADPDLDALFGSYDDAPAAPGLVSRYRNLLHHHIHQQGEFQNGARPAHTFWTGCGAIRRDVILQVGGFDPRLYRRPAIEDIELGYRLVKAGHRVALVRDIQATHLKRWTLPQVIRTDIFGRGVPWMLLILRSGQAETDLNVSKAQRVCVASTGLAGLGLLLAPWYWPAIALTAAGLALNVGLNLPFYRFLSRRLGRIGALACIPLHAIYYACCGLSVLIALTLYHWPTRSEAPNPDPDHRTHPDHARAAQGPHAETQAHTPRRPSRWIRPRSRTRPRTRSRRQP